MHEAGAALAVDKIFLVEALQAAEEEIKAPEGKVREEEAPHARVVEVAEEGGLPVMERMNLPRVILYLGELRMLAIAALC